MESRALPREDLGYPPPTRPGLWLPEVKIDNPFLPEGESCLTPALVDTGSDYSIIPMEWCRHLRLTAIDQREVHGIATLPNAPALEGTVFVASFSAPPSIAPPIKTEVIGVEHADAVLLIGRLTLERLETLLVIDWPKSAWAIKTRCPDDFQLPPRLAVRA